MEYFRVEDMVVDRIIEIASSSPANIVSFRPQKFIRRILRTKETIPGSVISVILDKLEEKCIEKGYSLVRKKRGFGGYRVYILKKPEKVDLEKLW